MRSSSSVVFFIRAYNDVDHFTPLIAEFISRKESPIVIVMSDLDYKSDYRFNYLVGLGELTIIEDIDTQFLRNSSPQNFLDRAKALFYRVTRSRKNLLGRVLRRMFFDCTEQMNFLRENNVTACVFEWCSPFERGEIIEKYFVAAKGMGITTFSIPHGCNIFVNSDVNSSYRKAASRGALFDANDQRNFDYYILQNPIRRDGWVKWGFDPLKTEAWGSLRFYPEWATTNRDLCPKYAENTVNEDKINVVFMQFQKDYNLHNAEVFSALLQLSNSSSLNLVVKDATREGKAFYDKHRASKSLGDALIGWYGNEVHSPALIEWADCVVVVGGSIGVEAMLQEKPVVYPTFLNSNQTLYEEFKAAHCVSSIGELELCLQQIHNNTAPSLREGVNAMISEVVYAGHEKFDVPEYYYQRIKENILRY